MNKLLKFNALVISLMFIANFAFSQGVTTAALKGKVVDDKDNALENVNVVLIHEPSGSQYGAITMQDGWFTIVGARVGGPYKVVISSVGFSNKEQTGIYLNLNQTQNLNFVLKQTDQQIEEVTISYDKADEMNAERTGAETFIKSKEINSLPTISRGQKDFTRLTPQSDGNSFGGMNNLYNNFSLDGSIFNNSFGLDYATPGGQADAQPVSLDAIEQIQVSLAPFDVREGGFTGAGVNAVTRSGANNIDASAYYYFRNQGMVGKKVGDVEYENFDFSTKLYGFRVGGPIVKNKLFFFVSAEAERRDQLAHGFVADNGSNSGDNVTSVPEADIIAVQQHLINEWGYDPGAYQGYNHETFNNKILVKLDWNISQKHKFSLRYNMLDAWKDILPHPEAIIGRGPTSYRLPFENSSYTINNSIHSVVSELNSRFSNKLANKLMVGYTAFRDTRDPHSAPFPVVDIWDANFNLAITAGSEMFSTNNVLDQDVFQFTDNLTYYADKHTITGGVNIEVFKFNNSFNLFYYPWHTFFGLADFQNNIATNLNTSDRYTVDLNADVTDSQSKDFAMAEVDVAQIGVYLQDEFQASDKFNVTLGLRVDFPVYLNEIAPDARIQEFTGWVDQNGDAVSVDPSQWPSSNPMFSPRLGFNWDVKGDNTLKVRGGSGIFTGRIPFVWLGNQSTNSFIADFYTFQVNSTADGFKYPQVWKNNLAVDYKFENGLVATFEGIYGKDINAVVHRNYDMLAPSQSLTGTGDTRAIFAGFNETHIYSSHDPVNFLEAGTIVMDNV
ncbi:MAG: TonB-dependent receptor, partial [Bacteroidota bacterium]